MTHSTTCSNRQMKKMNIDAIFTYLNKKGPSSRIELSRSLDLDRKTITNLIRDLIASDLLISKGFRQQRMGPPEEILAINPRGGYAIGVTVEPRQISASLVNLHGKIKKKNIEPILPTDSTDALLDKIQAIIASLFTKSARDTIVGIGLGYYGIMEKKDGVILSAANFPQWQGVHVYEFLENRIRMPFIVEDCSRCKAIAEWWFGAARDTNNFVFLDAGAGIGAILFLMGQLAIGISNEAGEIGHTLADPNGKPCQCGKTGCLETVASMDAVENSFREQYPEYKNATYAQIISLANEGHDGALSVIQQAGRYIGVALSNMLQIVNPGLVVFSGEMFKDNKILDKSINQALRTNLSVGSYSALTFKRSDIDDGNAEIGAAAMILKNVFEKAV